MVNEQHTGLESKSKKGTILHFTFHIAISIVIAILLGPPHPQTIGLGLLGGLLPDLDKVLWYFYAQRKRSFKGYVLWLAENMNHKRIFACLHNVYLLILSLLLIPVYRVFFACLFTHLLLDIFDDLIYLKKFKHWITLTKAME